ncbi:MAG: hypothetical protein GC155_09130 [Alphaproteobacteria bacterium]|nr:hypothetical protein [Alphaproteobacteria bacterium]
MTAIADFFAGHSWSIYLIAFLAPFVQEDVAVIGAATAAATGQEHGYTLLFWTWVGLFISDGWKYAAGRLANRIPWAAKLASDPRVVTAGGKVLKRLGLTLVIARFVPGTRIPLNVACGLFRVPAVQFLPLIAFSGALYIAISYAVFRTLGAIVGEQVRMAIPFVVVPLVILMVAVMWLRGRKKAPASPTAEAPAMPAPAAPLESGAARRYPSGGGTDHPEQANDRAPE